MARQSYTFERVLLFATWSTAGGGLTIAVCASNNDVVIEREDLRFVAHVPDQVHLKVEFEIEDDGTELEIELTW